MHYKVPINQPTLPELGKFLPSLKRIFKSRSITNNYFVQAFEKKVREYLKVKEAVAVSSATSGLVLLLHALKLKGKVLVPSFTFNATAHAICWNNLEPVFVDCDKGTFNLDFYDLEKKITPSVSAIMGVHVFGNPIDMRLLGNIAGKHRLKVVIDGAHALGSKFRARSVACFADATVFSLAPTKIVTSGEGGIIATNNRKLAAALRLLRNYGNPADYNCRDIGLNARMSELHAALGLECFKNLDKYLKQRYKLAKVYKTNLEKIKGISFQEVSDGDVSTYNYFAIVIDEKKAGASAALLYNRLLKEGIQSKRYFSPPVHMQAAYRKYYRAGALKNTRYLSGHILCLPFYSHIEKKTILNICAIIRKSCRKKISDFQRRMP